MSDAITESHKNFLVHEINDSGLCLVVNERTFPRHYHSNSDELFLVLEGKLTVEFADSPAFRLEPKDTLLVRRGQVHRTIANGRTVNLCFELLNSDTIMVEELSI